MSRIRIINLPNTVDEAQLRDHLAKHLSHGKRDITDVSIIRNAQGIVRMAFVGFQTASTGNKVSAELDGTYFGAMPIKVATALGLKESREAKEAEQKEKQAALEKRRAERRPQDGDGGDAEGALPHRRGRAGDDDGEGGDNVNVRLLQQSKEGSSWGAELLLPPEQQPAAAAAAAAARSQQSQSKIDASSDDAFLRSITTAGAGAENNSNSYQRHGGGGASNSPLTANSTRIRVTNLPYIAADKDLKNFFSSKLGAGNVADAHIPVTKDTQQSKGAGYVHFASHDLAERAAEECDGAVFMGRVIRVVVADEDPYALKKQQFLQMQAVQAALNGGDAGAAAAAGDATTSFREMRDAKRKKADALGLSWNTTYVGNSTAVTLAAKKLGVESSDIVNSKQQGAAVRAAVAEAHVTAEARKVLGAEGINFDLLSGDRALHCNRSDTTILVKHIAAGTSLQELSALFAKCGVLDAVAAPQDLSIALIRFADAAKAQSAFQQIAYRKLRGSPLFLEWAPIGSFNDDDEKEEDVGGAVASALGKKTNAAAAGGADGAAAADADDAPRTVHTIYITNLPFGVTEDTFRDFIADSVPKIAARPELIVKMSLMGNKGRAYVTVADAATEAMMITKLDGKNMQGRTLSAQMSKSAPAPAAGPAATAVSSSSAGGAVDAEAGRGRSNIISSAAAAAAPGACPAGRDPLKLIVKNLPFEATEADLRQLFAAFSEVKSVRVPRRVQRFNAHHTNNHRGFGFVEFLTADEAVRAKTALGSTHLYGRHLVLDFAEKAGFDFTQ